MPDATQFPSREWNSAAYHRVSGPQVSWGKKVLSRVKLRGDELLLDAGCGTGRLTGDLLQALPHGRVVGVDLSQNMLRTAREHLAPHFGDRVTFVAADLQGLPFSQAFDGIFSTAAFHWVPDHDRLFRSLFHALVPGGWLIAQSGGGPNLARLRERVRKLIATPKYTRFLGDFREPWEFADAETTAKRLGRAGFIDIETSLEPAPTVFESAARFSEFIRNVVVHRHLELIPDNRLRDEFVQDLTAQAAGDDPAYCLDYWRLNLQGKVPARS
jgi:trans-aconitate 2-methyltransferase